MALFCFKFSYKTQPTASNKHSCRKTYETGVVYPDLKIPGKCSRGRTKTPNVLTGPVAKHLCDNIKSRLYETQWYGFETDGSNNEDDKHLPELRRRDHLFD